MARVPREHPVHRSLRRTPAPGGGRRRGPVVPFVLALTVLSAACGTRLEHAEVVAANSGGGAGSVAQQAEGTGGARAGAVGGAAGADGGPSPDSTSTGSLASGGALGGTGTAGTGTSGGSRSGGGASGPQTRSAAEPGPKAPTGEPLVIASVGNYSGIAGESQKDGPRAVQIWAAWINARGGIQGHPVKVFVVDDGLDSSRYQAALKDLVENKKVIAFVGNFAPFTVAAGVKYLEDKQVPVVGGDCASYIWNQSSMLFNECASTAAGHYATARVGALYGKGKRFGGIFCSEAEACKQAQSETFAKGGAKRAGLTPVYQGNVSIGQPDFTAECLNARNAGVELLQVVADINTVGRVVSSCDRQGFRPQYLQAAGTMNARLAALPGMDGALVKLSTFPWTVTQNAAVKEFRDAYARFAPNDPLTPVASQGWASAKIFEAAAQGVSARPSSADILRGLWSFRNETFGGVTVPLSFARGKPSPPARCAFWMQSRGGKLVAPNGLRTVCLT